MGYRLEITDERNIELSFYGTKLFGYVKDNCNLLSFKYLKSIGKINDDNVFDYGYCNAFTLTAEQARRFVKLYGDDYYAEYNEPLSDVNGYEDLENVLATGNNKIVSWG